ncbi:MAG: 50S ribosomal protein L10 [bacterium]|jgi:large subunit ribosomal protein L10|nr:50S ribosomal protein L10 [Bacillota bacterium]HHW54923.1 50S ribosomal protein L10 [Bacillota bacterium]
MARPEKEAIVAELKEKLEQSKAAILTDYRGLNVAAMTELRRLMREQGLEYRVVKNTLTRFAAQELGLDDLEPYLEGPTAIAFSFEDPVAPAKVIMDFAKEHKQLEVKAGLLRGKVIQPEGVKELADLPPREVLLAQVLGGLQAPIAGLVGVLNGAPRNLVYVLEAIRKQKEEAS